jgi:hypothetical protein
LHRTLKEATAMPPADSLTGQQTRFDAFRAEYNGERPHQALAQKTPASLFQSSPRPYPGRLEEPAYPAEQAVRRVRSKGQIQMGGRIDFCRRGAY